MTGPHPGTTCILRRTFTEIGDLTVMEVTPLPIPGLLVFTPQPHRDPRGFFSRTFDADIARDAGIDPAAFIHVSMSRSPPALAAALSPGAVRRAGRKYPAVRLHPGRVGERVSGTDRAR